ncbi:MAG: DUF3263 domain-containing protein [Candidatus Nanopelagicales bacterium]
MKRQAHHTAHDDSQSRWPELTELERGILQLEQQWFRHAGVKEDEIRRRFDMSATRYYQVLNGLLDKPDALAAAPQLVTRLCRLRAARQRSRYSRRRVLGNGQQWRTF